MNFFERQDQARRSTRRLVLLFMAAVANHISDNLNLVGIAMRDEKKSVDKVVKGLKLHP